jgi:hypothetical protein
VQVCRYFWGLLLATWLPAVAIQFMGENATAMQRFTVVIQ